mgnify:CR=1 FL=1
MDDSPTAVLDRVAVDDVPTVRLWRILDDIPAWPVLDHDPPLTVADPRLHRGPVALLPRKWSTSTATLELLLDGLHRL